MRYLLVLLASTFGMTAQCVAEDVMSVAKMPTQLKIVTSRHCMHGDFDLVLQDYMHRQSGFKVFVAVQQMESGTERVFPMLESVLADRSGMQGRAIDRGVIDKTRGFLDSGHTMPGLSEVMKSDGSYEVRVCSDSSAQPSCFKGRKVEDIGELLKQYQNPPEGHQSVDHVYFGQIVTRKGASVEFLKDSVNETNQKELAERVGSKGSGIAELTTLRSFPLRVEDGALVIDLPVFSQEKCGSPQAVPQAESY